MQWVADLTYDDHDMLNPPKLSPGQPFVKAWRVRNSGSCTWDSTYALVYLTGNTPAASMGGQPSVVDRPVNPGETYDFHVNLVAPLVPGIYQGFWTMRNGAGVLFGDRVSVGIEVISPATSTPPPTQTPSPSIQFTVDRTQIRQGECVLFSWSVQNVQAIYFYADGEPWQENGVPGQGSSTECPPATTSYNLRVVFRDGTVEIRKIRIDVEPAPVDAPRIARFSVIPENQIYVGQCVDISWDVQGEVTRVTITRNSTALWDPAPVSGNIQDCPPGPGTAAYVVEATGPGGTSRSQRNVNVIEPVAPPPTATPMPPTPAPKPPVINAFSVTPNQIQSGQCVLISWRTGGGTSFVQMLRNGMLVLDNGPTEGSAQDCLTDAGTFTYRLIAINSAGDSVAQEASTNVIASQPQNPLAGTAWAADQYNNGVGGIVPVLPGTTLTLVFDADGTLNGSAGCNDYSTSYTVDDNRIAIGTPAITTKVCAQPDGIMEQESAFLAALESAVTFEISGLDLILSDESGTTAVQAIGRQ
jgi:heat shock protein HslJ